MAFRERFGTGLHENSRASFATEINDRASAHVDSIVADASRINQTRTNAEANGPQAVSDAAHQFLKMRCKRRGSPSAFGDRAHARCSMLGTLPGSEYAVASIEH